MCEGIGSDDPNGEDNIASKENHGMDVDEILTAAGGFGRFQGILSLALVYLVLTVGQNFVSSVFIGSDPPWTCTNNNTRDFCTKNFGHDIFSDSDDFKVRCSWNSTEWKYTTDKDYSYVTEFDLICSKTSISALAASAIYMGGMLGSSVAGRK